MAEKLEPRPAATLLLLRDGNLGPEAFLLQRTPNAAFLAGAHVFPGGALEDSSGVRLNTQWIFIGRLGLVF